MFVADSKIKSFGEKLISPFRADKRLGPISYDLTAKEFHTTRGEEIISQREITLEPGESTFVSCEEIINLPNNMSAVINARNSKIRQGLALDAPIYLPGHKTRVFFRITNISKDKIFFQCGERYAAIYFQTIDGVVDRPYEGVFSDELNFRGMAEYRGEYKKAMQKMADKMTEVKGMERSIYANVLVIMTIFVALFSLININISLVKDGNGVNMLFRMLVFNLGTVGSIAVLIGFANSIIRDKINKVLLGIGGVCFAIAILLATRCY